MEPTCSAVQVAFPLQLDAYEFATPELKAQLDGPRSTEAAAEDERDAAAKRQKREAVSIWFPGLDSGLGAGFRPPAPSESDDT